MPYTTPRLGPGAIYLRSLDRFFRSNGDLIKVAEIEPQILWTKGTSPNARPTGNPAERRALISLPQHVLTHGVGNPIGGTLCDQTAHIPEFDRWNRELGVAWTSEHLSILHVRNGSAAQSCGFLMPPVQTDAGVSLAARNIAARRTALGLPFAFETGVNYFDPREGEMPDGEFFAAVAEQADCGILLDLTNLWINQQNGRADIREIMSRLPLERIWEIHLAGVEQERGFWVDAHSREVDPELVALTAEIVPNLPNLGAIIFELAPDRAASFGETAYLHQIETLHRLWDRVPQTRSPSGHAARVRKADRRPSYTGLTPADWERAIGERMLPESYQRDAADPPVGLTCFDEERFILYSHLASSFRYGALAELLGNTIRIMLLALGRETLEAVIDSYCATTPPAAFPTDEAVRFGVFLKANPLPVPGLADVLTFETSLIESATNNTTVTVIVRDDIDAVLSNLAAGRLPILPDASPAVLEIAVDPVPSIRVVDRSCDFAPFRLSPLTSAN